MSRHGGILAEKRHGLLEGPNAPKRGSKARYSAVLDIGLFQTTGRFSWSRRGRGMTMRTRSGNEAQRSWEHAMFDLAAVGVVQGDPQTDGSCASTRRYARSPATPKRSCSA